MKRKNSLFYSNIDKTEEIEAFMDELEKYAEAGINPVYIINRLWKKSLQFITMKRLLYCLFQNISFYLLIMGIMWRSLRTFAKILQKI